MKRTVISIVASLAASLVFATMASAATGYASAASPVAVVHHQGSRVAPHTESYQSVQIPAIGKMPVHLSFSELRHPWHNLVRRPRQLARKAAAARKAARQAQQVVSYSSAPAHGPWPGGAFGACVVARESGGNPQIMNSSGHYGLYQFSYQTWVAYGGNPADFGHASVAEQEQVFMNAIAAGGESNWAPYDGC